MSNFSRMAHGAREERRLTIDPRHEEPPYGDVPFAYPVRKMEEANRFFHLVLSIIAAFVVATFALATLWLVLPKR